MKPKATTAAILFAAWIALASAGAASAANYVTASAGQQNAWTDPIVIMDRVHGGVGQLNVSISGTWAGTVTLQRSFNQGTTYHDVETWTSNAEEQLWDLEADVYYRIGVATGDYTSGTAVLRLSK